MFCFGVFGVSHHHRNRCCISFVRRQPTFMRMWLCINVQNMNWKLRYTNSPWHDCTTFSNPHNHYYTMRSMCIVQCALCELSRHSIVATKLFQWQKQKFSMLFHIRFIRIVAFRVTHLYIRLLVLSHVWVQCIYSTKMLIQTSGCPVHTFHCYILIMVFMIEKQGVW